MRDLETNCLACLRKEPARRYGTAQALAEDLRRFQQYEPIRQRMPKEIVNVPSRVGCLTLLPPAHPLKKAIRGEEYKRSQN
jgi:hypothetical protein